MQQKKNQLISTRSSFKKIKFSHFEPQFLNLQQKVIHAVSTLNPERALQFLDSLQQNSHLVFCLRTKLLIKTQNYKLAFGMCIKAIQYPSQCTKCISSYIKLYELLLPRKLPFLDLLLKKCQKGQIQNNQIFQQLKKIKECQNHDLVYQDIFTELSQNGAEFSKISINSQNSDNRTVISRASIDKDQTILFIPKKKMILLNDARQSEIVKKIQDQKLYLQSPKHCQLTIYLLEQHEKGQQSVHWLYIKHLPQNFDCFPINYTSQQMDYLRGSPFYDQIEQKIIDMRRDYDAICSIYPNFMRFQFDNFKKYRLIVSSRLFGISIGKMRTDALVPLADMLNHNVPKQTSWYYSDQHEGFVIKSIKKIQKGEQIYDSYGLKCNSRFLLNYGFTMIDNEHNELTIKIPFQYEEQQGIHTYRQVTLRITMNIETKQFEQLLSVLRHSITQQSQKSRDFRMQKIKATPFTNIDIEAKIWQKFQNIIESQLHAYPTTLKQDSKLLMNKDLPLNVFNCLVLRKGQKQILHFYQKMAKKLIKYFRNGANKKGFEQVKQYDNYLKQLNFF